MFGNSEDDVDILIERVLDKYTILEIIEATGDLTAPQLIKELLAYDYLTEEDLKKLLNE